MKGPREQISNFEKKDRPQIQVGPFPEAPKLGEMVEIIDPKSKYYGQTGKVVKEGKTGGLYIKHDDGQEVYHPWGWERVRKSE